MGTWETQAWLPIATANLPNIPLLAVDAAGIKQTPGRSTGLIYQNVDPPYAMPNLHAVVRWIPTRRCGRQPSARPWKVANTFAIESFTDEIAAPARVDPVEFRLKRPATRAASRCCSGRRRAWAGSPGPHRARSTGRPPCSRAAASPTCTTSTTRPWWPWAWRWKWSARPGAFG